MEICKRGYDHSGRVCISTPRNVYTYFLCCFWILGKRSKKMLYFLDVSPRENSTKPVVNRAERNDCVTETRCWRSYQRTPLIGEVGSGTSWRSGRGESSPVIRDDSILCPFYYCMSRLLNKLRRVVLKMVHAKARRVPFDHGRYARAYVHPYVPWKVFSSRSRLSL